MQTTPTNLKGFFVTEDIRSEQHIRQQQCISIENYEYTLQKSRQDNGLPHSTAVCGSMLTITMSIGTRNSMKVLYERIHSSSPTAYSVVFDAKFDEHDIIEDFYSAFILTGNIVGINEDFESAPEKDHENFTITVNILINKLTVLGKTSNVTLN